MSHPQAQRAALHAIPRALLALACHTAPDKGGGGPSDGATDGATDGGTDGAGDTGNGGGGGGGKGCGCTQTPGQSGSAGLLVGALNSNDLMRAKVI